MGPRLSASLRRGMTKGAVRSLRPFTVEGKAGTAVEGKAGTPGPTYRRRKDRDAAAVSYGRRATTVLLRAKTSSGTKKSGASGPLAPGAYFEKSVTPSA
jgi:hypothetical protein